MTTPIDVILRFMKTGQGDDQAIRALKDIERNSTGANRGLTNVGRGATQSSFNLKSMATTGAAVGAALGTVAVAAGAAYKAVNEGAELQAAEIKFGNLAESIGTTAEALQGELRAATKGMVSDADLMTGASDLINLGLAKTQDQAVRLGAAVGALGLDLGVLSLTLANDSTARLDSLGLSMEEVKQKAAELKAEGFTGDAFDEAVLLSLEDKMSLFGDASETTAGQLAILKAEAKNTKDEVLQFLSSLAAPTIERLAKSTEGYRLQLHATALEMASTADNADDMRRIINQQFGEGRDLFKQAEEMGLAYIDLGHGQSIWIDELERASGYSIPRFGEGLAELNRMAQEYTVVTGTSAVGAASDFGAELARLSQMGQEAQQVQNALNREMNAMTAGALRDVGSTIGDPIRNLLQAQQDLTDSQGEWVQTTVDNTGRIGAVNSQLANDLSDEQARAMREILNTVEEGSTDWLNAYSALQNDLTDSQREALIAQRAELEAAQGTLGSAYTGSIQGAEDAQAAIDEANQQIIASYRELAFEGALSLAELSPDPEAIQRTLDYAVAIGQISQEEADMRLAAAEARLGIEALNEIVVKGGVDADIAAAAFELLASGQAKTAEEAIAAAEAAAKLALTLEGVPSEIRTHISVTSDPLPSLPTGAGTSGAGNQGLDAGVQVRAIGGPITGGAPYYGPGADNVIIAAQTGEFMLKRSAVQKLGLNRLNYMNATGRLPTFQDGGSIGGGNDVNPLGGTSIMFQPIIQVTGVATRQQGLESGNNMLNGLVEAARGRGVRI